MSNLISKFSSGVMPVVNADSAGEVIRNAVYIDLAVGDLTAGKLIDIGILPAFHTIVDATLVPDDLDSGTPAITLDVGLMSGTPGDAVGTRTIGSELFAASTAAQGGTVTRMSAAAGFKIASTDADRSIGVKIVDAPATAQAGRITLVLLMAAA